ncbi:phage tail protein [Flavobacterium lipolyticum]|uniref:Phage tail protein n=1 Tax=Flavobacterium lipolyticum TaxID=2893754 RepID=A0ABS8M6L0_9FLAO|nr:phage tail protein [Flavobacterium sp. F-126]MCC9020459.1 phage tail protein [Flavobacterium sp. F-126]
MGNNSISDFTQVPIRTIVPFAFKGDFKLDGWLICDGKEIPAKHVTLRNSLGNYTPNLAGRTLVGTGTADDSKQPSSISI